MNTASTAAATTITGIDVHAYLVKDVKRAVSFYRDILGMKVTEDLGQGAEFELSDGSTFGLWHMSDGSWHPSAGVMFAVPDIQALVARCKAHGVKVIEDPMDLPSCTMAVLEDSEGNTFILHRRK